MEDIFFFFYFRGSSEVEEGKKKKARMESLFFQGKNSRSISLFSMLFFLSL